jgi:hypothetical protein
MLRKTLALAAVVSTLAGCQTWGPTWSEVTGRRFHRADPNRAPTVIEHIDGRSAFPGDPIRIEPGKRVMTLQGIPPSPAWRGGTLQGYILVAEPCKRYFVNAQFDNRLTRSDWEPVIDHVETIAGCSMAPAQ